MDQFSMQAYPSSRIALRLKGFFFHPAWLTLVLLLVMVLMVIAAAGWDPLELARIGTRFSAGDPQGTEGYDGQFVYYIARDLNPQTVAPQLDVPAYRYQRILLSLLARFLSLGIPSALPWVLAMAGILAQAAGTWAVAELLDGWGVWRGYALVYGLWAGFVLAVRLDLHEPLAFALVAGALLAGARRRMTLSWLLYGLAVFAKEVTLVFVLAQLLADLLQRKWRRVVGLSLMTLVPFGLFQIWLWWTFGAPGVGSGGAMATPFEIVPFMGLLRIAPHSGLYLAAMLVVFGPSLILPSLWGLWQSMKEWFTGERNVLVLALFLNALLIPFLPFSTFRETGGLMRYACGLVLALVLFSGYYHKKRVLNYSLFLLVLNVFLFKS